MVGGLAHGTPSAASQTLSMNEGDLVDAPEAVRQAYQAHYRRLVVTVYGLTGDHAEAQDIVQETFARALAKRHEFLELTNPEAWLRTVAINLVRSRRRRRLLFDTLVRTGRVERQPDSVPGLSANRVVLVSALRRLPRPIREAVVLYYLGDLSVEQIAATLQIAPGTVKSRLHRGRAALADLLRDDDQRESAVGDAPITSWSSSSWDGSAYGSAVMPTPVTRELRHVRAGI